MRLHNNPISWRSTRTSTQRVSMKLIPSPSPASPAKHQASPEEAVHVKPSSPIGNLPLQDFFVQLLVQMEPFENELQGRGHRRSALEHFEPLERLMQPPQAAGFLTIDGCWHSIGDFKTMARRKMLQE